MLLGTDDRNLTPSVCLVKRQQLCLEHAHAGYLFFGSLHTPASARMLCMKSICSIYSIYDICSVYNICSSYCICSICSVYTVYII